MLLKETLGTAFIFFKKLLSALPIFYNYFHKFYLR